MEEEDANKIINNFTKALLVVVGHVIKHLHCSVIFKGNINAKLNFAYCASNFTEPQAKQ